MLKIVTGKKKGITIASTKAARELRPTQAKVREALINMLFNSGLIEAEIEEINALDLYAGVGSVGLELLSNGVDSVTFVERDSKCMRILKANLENLDFQNKSIVLLKTLPNALKSLKEKSKKATKFDLIFADAPYKDKNFRKIFESIIELELLEKSGIFIWECDDADLEKAFEGGGFAGFELVKKKQYGDSFLYVFKAIS